jgi:hypothetical protein
MVAASPHALLTVSHDVPVIAFRLFSAFAERSTKLQVHTNLIARPDPHVRANDRTFALFIAIVAATP